MRFRVPPFLRRRDEEERALAPRDRTERRSAVVDEDADVHALQRAAGNRTVRGLLDSPSSMEGREDDLGRPMELGVRRRMERALGADFGDVRIHTGEAAASEVRRHGAQAFAVGKHVAFEHGRYRPGTPVGDAILAHELAHTLQHDSGAGPGPGPAVHRLEADADRAALGAMGTLWGAGRAMGRAAAAVGPRLRSGTQMQFLYCEPAFEAPDYLGPHSIEALEEINRIAESGAILEHVIVFGTVATLATSSPEETLASGSYDVTPQAEALRAVPVIVRRRIIDVITLLLVQHENDMNDREKEFWRRILRRMNAL